MSKKRTPASFYTSNCQGTDKHMPQMSFYQEITSYIVRCLSYYNILYFCWRWKYVLNKNVHIGNAPRNFIMVLWGCRYWYVLHFIRLSQRHFTFNELRRLARNEHIINALPISHKGIITNEKKRQFPHERYQRKRSVNIKTAIHAHRGCWKTTLKYVLIKTN